MAPAITNTMIRVGGISGCSVVALLHRALLPVFFLFSVHGCALVEFEHGPYSIRNVWVVYSEQEDLTFLSWEIGKDADPDRVVFELASGAAFEEIKLDKAPFPASAYPCGQGLCFQYQLPGRVKFPTGAVPIRSVHDIDGTIKGPEPRLFFAVTTFNARPFAYYSNTTLDIGLRCWFAEHSIPIERRFEWQLVESNDERGDDACKIPTGRWKDADSSLDIGRAWLDSRHCLALRPARADNQSPHILLPIEASALTRRENRRYVPGIAHGPIVVGYIFDLEIPDKSLCHLIQSDLVARIESELSKRGEIHRVGVFTPLEANELVFLDGCTQQRRRLFPRLDMVESIEKMDLDHYDDFRVIWFYLNNLLLPLDWEIAEQLYELELDGHYSTGAEPMMVAIASTPVVYGGYPWYSTILWRNHRDRSLDGDIAAFARTVLPMRTMEHSLDTLVPLEPPAGPVPEYFKLCNPDTPFHRIVAGEAQEYSWPEVMAWPRVDLPRFSVYLGEQQLVPYTRFAHIEFTYQIEVCYEYCDKAFRLTDGTIVPNWMDDVRCRRLEANER